MRAYPHNISKGNVVQDTNLTRKCLSKKNKRKTKNESRKTKNKPQNGDYKFHCKLDHEKAHSSD